MARIVIRWFGLLAFVALGLFCLNNAAHRAWVASSAADGHPSAWLFSAGSFSVWSVAAGLAAFGIFFLFRGSRPVSKLPIFILVFSLALAVSPFFREFLAVDACLDSGGQWLKTEFRCRLG